ncbi:MAG: SH3 domain-containing protein [Chloroflexota bacterium]|nr:SH3 domain-containing protein [Chloroflexota bacterium]
MKKMLPLFLLALVVTGSHIAKSQSSNPDIYTYQNGDLWRYSLDASTAMPLTGSGYNGGPVLSPDGRLIAFLEAAPSFVADFNAGIASQTAGTPPADIWILDIAGQNLSKIADQNGASSAGYLRSTPAWSPDSRKLAWLQIDPLVQTLEGASLQVYSLDTGATVSLAGDVNLGYQESNITVPGLRWSAGGIARMFFAFLYGNQSPFTFLEVFNPTTGTRRQFNLERTPDIANLASDFMWADHLGQNLILLRIQDHWEVLNPLDGSRSRLTDAPRLKNRFLTGGLELIPTAVANQRGDWEIHWRAVTGGRLYDTGYISRDTDVNRQPALSSDGSQMAWHNGERVSVWRLGMLTEARALASDAVAYNAFPIPGPVSLVWAPMEWVTTGVVAAAQAAPASEAKPGLCALAPQLSPGQQAVVSPGLANRVRRAASLNAEVVGRIQAGEVVTVIQGPVCAGGYYWYSVQGAGFAGWTVEGIDGDYWLLYHVDCFNSPPIRLGKGMIAAVSAGEANNIRDGAGTSGTSILGGMPAGTNFLITDYPECDAEGRRWFPIQHNQLEGWTAAGQGAEYWIEPALSQATG